MLLLKINPTRKEDLLIKQKLDEMFLAKKVEIIDTLEVPIILQGKEEYKGKERIQQFFEELKVLYNGWYEDRCDKYEKEDGTPMF
ncbi:hypothetical protein [Flammeovirga sp. EKP202]|uniref:hypothetical protein n=1 Tax=Flammeovirga sp. EKP202 TaxID=2770592 RepID=UPI00165FF13C|nr:hypothetical protein [Flammeovirga sp. EKP202]MBD0404267.1 hypothetical protein [Flammeovirga sp. EKP202]